MLFGLGLGSSLGDREGNLQLAVACLCAHPGMRLGRVSRIYETPALQNLAHGRFLNAAISVDWEDSPAQLLRWVKRCEERIGRVRSSRWGDRLIDIDLLWWEGEPISEEHLQVPHPGLLNRNFAIWPLLEVIPWAGGPSGVPYGQRLGDLRAPSAIGVLAG